eukprot:4524097-Prorocentrum_lima.AAC.1
MKWLDVPDDSQFGWVVPSGLEAGLPTAGGTGAEVAESLSRTPRSRNVLGLLSMVSPDSWGSECQQAEWRSG